MNWDKYNELMNDVLLQKSQDRQYKKPNPEFKSYYGRVKRLSDKNAAHLPNFNKRGFRAYNMDHIVPVKFGFENNIPIPLMASLENLRIITFKENRDKWFKLTDEAVFLLKKWGYEISEYQKGKTQSCKNSKGLRV